MQDALRFGEEVLGAGTMGTGLEKLRREHGRLLRVMLIGSIGGAIVAYPVLVAAKLLWDLPDHDWWRVALGPLILFGLPIIGLRRASWLDLREAWQLDDLA